MSLPLICELGINTFDRARRNAKQRLQPSLRRPGKRRKQPSVPLKQEYNLRNWIAPMHGLTVRVRGLTTQMHLSV